MSEKAQRLTNRQKRLKEKAIQKVPTLQKQHFELKKIYPKTENQEKVFDFYNQGNHLFLHGCAGTGKTFVSIYLALKEILDMRSERNRLVIIRNTQSSKDQGFLPGDEKQKAAVYEAAYKAICSDLFNRADAYDILKQKGILEFHTTSYLRGTTIDNAIILIDEFQNQSSNEIMVVMTRVGDNSRVIVCGDLIQTDHRFELDKRNLEKIYKILLSMKNLSAVEFVINDILRSEFVKEWIIKCHEHKLY